MSEKQTLVSLTKAFMDLIMASGGKEIELSQAELQLNANKRRLYDVTNVLVGIGLIERAGKSKVRWIGGEQTNQGNYHEQLIEKEANLDKLITLADNYLNEFQNSDFFSRFAWVSPEDILNIPELHNLSIFSLKGPPSLEMQVDSSHPQSDTTSRFICSTPEGHIEIRQITSDS